MSPANWDKSGTTRRRFVGDVAAGFGLAGTLLPTMLQARDEKTPLPNPRLQSARRQEIASRKHFADDLSLEEKGRVSQLQEERTVMDIRDFDARAIERNTKRALHVDVTTTPGGTPIRQTALTVGGIEAGPLMVVSGGVHGDEWEGPLSIIHLFKELTPRSLRGTFVGLVVANVPAFDAAMHSSPIDGLSLNSAFPGDPKGSITRQIAYWMGRRFIGPSDFYIDLHSSSSDIDFPTLCVYKPGTGRAAELSRQAAEAFHAPVTWAFPDYGPRRPFSYAHEHDIPALSTECPASRRVIMQDVSVYQRGVRNAMRVMEMLEGDLEGPPTRHYLYGNPESTAVTAGTSGYLILRRELLDWVEQGQILATIIDLTGEIVEEVRATTSGYVLLRRLVPTVQAGDLLFYLVGKHARGS